MARTLLVMRHGKSSWDEVGVPDHDRALTGRGKRDALRMGQELRGRGLVPDLIVSSTAKRARSTAKRVAEGAGYTGEIAHTPDIYGQGVEGCLDALRALPDDVERVLLIGHNPTLEELVHRLTQQDVALPTAALAEISLPINHWRAMKDPPVGHLRALILPRELT